MSIAEVIGWKFNNQPGMRCKEINDVMTIVEFPGGIPSQTEQDLWTSEYNAWVAGGGLLDQEADIEQKFDPTLKAFALVILDEINLLRTQHSIPVRTIAQLKNAVKNKL